LWLRNLYHVHQRLCMAFPSDSRKESDPDFLSPYRPEDFPEQRHLADKKKTEVDVGILEQVHTERKADSGFLFRIDPGRGGRAIIIVQSAAEPDWDYAFHNAGFILAAPAEKKPFDPRFETGQRLQFRLLANPTRRLTSRSPGPDGQPVRSWANEKGTGKRVPVPADKLGDWLARQSERAGFSAEQKSVAIQPGYIYMSKAKSGQRTRLRSVRYDGILTVKDPAHFHEALVRGLGAGKAFGFGLLSVGPI
jgi:CRISPR system Cascade subunit CasE